MAPPLTLTVVFVQLYNNINILDIYIIDLN